MKRLFIMTQVLIICSCIEGGPKDNCNIWSSSCRARFLKEEDCKLKYGCDCDFVTFGIIIRSICNENKNVQKNIQGSTTRIRGSRNIPDLTKEEGIQSERPRRVFKGSLPALDEEL